MRALYIDDFHSKRNCLFKHWCAHLSPNHHHLSWWAHLYIPPILAPVHCQCLREIHSYIMAATHVMHWGQWSFGSAELDILSLPLIGITYVIFLWSFCVVCSCINQKKSCRSKGSRFVSSHICFSYLSIPFYIFRAKQKPGKWVELIKTVTDHVW